jgi:hypothetical protein
MGINKSTYIVVSGDTLWGISKKFGVSVDRLARWNNITNIGLIRPGQILIVKHPVSVCPEILRKKSNLPTPPSDNPYKRKLDTEQDSIERNKMNMWRDQIAGYSQTGGFGIGLATRASHIYGNIDMAEFSGGISKGFMHKGAYVFRYAYEIAKKIAFYYHYFGGKPININFGGNNEQPKIEKSYVDSIPILRDSITIPLYIEGPPQRVPGKNYSISPIIEKRDTTVRISVSDSLYKERRERIFRKRNW